MNLQAEPIENDQSKEVIEGVSELAPVKDETVIVDSADSPRSLHTPHDSLNSLADHEINLAQTGRLLPISTSFESSLPSFR